MVVLPAADQDITFKVIRRDPHICLESSWGFTYHCLQFSLHKPHVKYLSHSVCHTMLITQYLTYCIFPSLCNTDCVTNKEQFGPTSSLSLAALASASAFCFSASAWCFILLFLECTELAALLVVSRTLK